MAYIFWLRENVLQPGDQFYDWKLYAQNKAPLMFDLLDEVCVPVGGKHPQVACLTTHSFQQIAVRYPSHRSYIADIWYSLLRRDFSLYTPVLAVWLIVSVREPSMRTC